MTNTIFIIGTIIVTLITKATKGDITCTAVSTPDDSIIMCSFGVDIPTTRHGINVKYYESPDQSDGDTILMCNYKESGDTICRQKPDIVYHEIIKENVIIKRNPHHQRGGQYKCQVVPPLGVAITPCNISFIEVPTTKPPPTAPQPPVTGYPAGGHVSQDDVSALEMNSICTNVTGQGDKTQHTSDWASVATFVLFLLVIILVFILVIAIILYWKRQRIRHWWKVKRTGAPDSMNVEIEVESLMEVKDPQEDESSPGMTVEAYYYYKGWAHACNYGSVDKTKMPKEWVEECHRFFADKTQIPQDKSWLDPMNPHTEKQMPVKDSVKKGVYEAPVAREAKLDMTRDQWLEQKKQKEKMAKAEKDRKTRERTPKETTLDTSNSRPDSTYGASSCVPSSDAPPGVTCSSVQYAVQPVTVSTANQGQVQMSDSLGEDANTTDPQDVGACVPLMEGEQEPDGERTTALLTVDEATRKVKEAETKVQETKKVKNETKKAANKDANKHCEEVQTQAKNAGERYEKAKEVLEEAKSALETAKKAKKNKDKK